MLSSAEQKPQTAATKLVAPFPYFGGKRRATDLVWPRFGVVANYVEPFCGSAAMLLGAPSGHRVETVNDANAYIANFWRAVQSDPNKVALWADCPVTEIDLEARHGWLANRAERLRWSLQDPDFFDAKVAGWWVWGACAWIGSGWCTGKGPWFSNGVEFSNRRALSAAVDSSCGIKRALPHVGNAGMGLNRQLPGAGCAERHNYILEWFRSLCDRLRHVRVLCGDWSRAVTPVVTVRHGVTAVFLDPPYGADAVAKGLYAQEGNVTANVRAWCAEHGDNPALRIALCGYEGEYDLPGWTVIVGPATTGGGYGNTSQNANHHRERIWFSPHCVSPVLASSAAAPKPTDPGGKEVGHELRSSTGWTCGKAAEKATFPSHPFSAQNRASETLGLRNGREHRDTSRKIQEQAIGKVAGSCPATASEINPVISSVSPVPDFCRRICGKICGKRVAGQTQSK